MNLNYTSLLNRKQYKLTLGFAFLGSLALVCKEKIDVATYCYSPYGFKSLFWLIHICVKNI